MKANQPNQATHERAAEILRTAARCIDKRFGCDCIDDEVRYFESDEAHRWSIAIRAWDAFTDRAGVEDDDWPNFTSHDEIVAILADCVDDEPYEYDAWDDEKKWFRILLTIKK